MSFNARQWYYDCGNEYAANGIFGNIGSNTASSNGSGNGNGNGNGNGGILRKTTAGSGVNSNLLPGSMTSSAATENRQIDLLVFGYACKVFRDDVKALEIDQGKHLIPWMGDTNLKIDRYDVRGALYDLTPYEAPAGGYGNRLDYLTAEEQRAELLCEEERYLFLHNNEEDYNTRQEEELKRLQQETTGGDYSQVHFSYDQNDSKSKLNTNNNDNANEKKPLTAASAVEVEQPFVLAKNFEIPGDIILPETMKQHAIIEKTARFIAVQGVQMEILIKAKQSNNVQFEFLAQNSPLNPYYKHVLTAIKNGSYPQTTDNASNSTEISKQNTGERDVCDMWDEHNASLKPIVSMPTIKYKPSPDCAYTQLISKIKGVPLIDLQQNNTEENTSTDCSTVGSCDPSNAAPILLQYNQSTYVPASGNCTNDDEPKVEILKNTSALALAQNYSSDSNSDDEDSSAIEQLEKLGITIPTDNLKNIIDKTAIYVVKNGRKFEETLLTKSEERFTFLLSDNEYYPYYLYKITGDTNAASKEQKQRKAAAVAAALLSKKGLTTEKNISPVSFSIKSKEETNSSNLQQQPQPVLPQDHSDEEESETCLNSNGEQKNRHVPEHVQKAIQFVESQLMARNAKLVAANAINLSIPTAAAAAVVETFPSTMVSPKPLISNTQSRVEKQQKSEAERNALYEQQQQNKHKEMKKAEEKVKDKLAQIAREKLGGIVSKEKQLQLERKRKAMAFLNQIKGSTSKESTEIIGAVSEGIVETTNVLNKNDNASSNESDVESLHSIPITSYGPEGNTDEETDSLSLTKVIVPSLTPPIYQDKNTTNDNSSVVLKANHIVVSDDEDVQLVSETIIDKTKLQRHVRSRSRRQSHLSNTPSSRSQSTSSSNSIHDDNDDDGNDHKKSRKRKSKSKTKSTSTHKRKKSKKSSAKNKKKTKKSSKSRSRSRHRSKSISLRHKRRRSRSRSPYRSHSSHSRSSSSSESLCKTKHQHSQHHHRHHHHHSRKHRAHTPTTSKSLSSRAAVVNHKKSKYEDKSK